MLVMVVKYSVTIRKLDWQSHSSQNDVKHLHNIRPIETVYLLQVGNYIAAYYIYLYL